MPNIIYLNMFKILCKDINVNLRQMLYNHILYLLKYVEDQNIRERYVKLKEKVDKLRMQFKMPIDTEEALASMEVQIEQDKQDLIPDVNTFYKEFLEWVFFYWGYEIYPIVDDKATLGNSIEDVISNAYTLINSFTSDFYLFEIKVKDKREILEKILDKRKDELLGKISQVKKLFISVKEEAHLKLPEELVTLLKPIQVTVNGLLEDLSDLLIKQDLLQAYPSEDERLEIIKREIDPWLGYLIISAGYKDKIKDFQETRTIDFVAIKTISRNLVIKWT